MSNLHVPVSDSDHIQGGDHNAPVTLVEYGDFQCSVCGRAYPEVRKALSALQNGLRFVYRNFPLSTVHEYAEVAAEASEAAATAGKFWEMHDILFENQDDLTADSLVRYAESLSMDSKQFVSDLEEHTYEATVREEFLGGVKSGVNGTPTFFINGVRYDGRWEHGALLRALEEAVYSAR